MPPSIVLGKSYRQSWQQKRAYPLTPAEAKIAIALLQGGDLRGIAAAQRVSLETVRTQLKSVFAKTNTARQADLIALLMRATSH